MTTSTKPIVEKRSKAALGPGSARVRAESIPGSPVRVPGTTDPRLDGACGTPGVDPELFFPLGHGIRFEPQIAAAKAVCTGCPVLEQCRRFGLSDNAPAYGILGGLTEVERREIRAAGSRLRTARRNKTVAGIEFPRTPPTLRADAVAILRQVLDTVRATGAETFRVADLPRDLFTRVRDETWVRAELQKMVEAGELHRAPAAHPKDRSVRLVFPAAEPGRAGDYAVITPAAEREVA